MDNPVVVFVRSVLAHIIWRIALKHGVEREEGNYYTYHNYYVGRINFELGSYEPYGAVWTKLMMGKKTLYHWDDTFGDPCGTIICKVRGFFSRWASWNRGHA